MTAEDNFGKSFNISRASRTSDVEVNLKHIKKYDERRAKFVRSGRRYLGLALIMLSLTLKLYIDGLLLWGALPMLITLFAFFKWYMYRNASQSSVYKSGMLVPAIVVNTNPIELAALANVICEDVDLEQLACKRFAVKSLPLHRIEEGEKVPCVALFGGKEKGIWTNFEPRPLCWATDDAEMIRRNAGLIEEREWSILNKVAGELSASEDEIVLLDADEKTGEVKIRVDRVEREGLYFEYPETWKTEIEDLGDGCCHIVCEKKGDNTQEVITITTEMPEKEPSEKMRILLEVMKKQKVYENMNIQLFENVVYSGFDGMLCIFSSDYSGVKYFGRIHVFKSTGKMFTIFMQDTEDMFASKFKFFEDSFKAS